MILRLATANDADNIAAIHSRSWKENYQNALSAEYLATGATKERQQLWRTRLHTPEANQRVIVADNGRQLCAFVCMYLSAHQHWGSYIDNLHVLRTHHRQGLGRALLGEAARISYQQQAKQGMYLLVNQDNQKAQAFYKKLGANKAESAIWHAPDGSAVPTYYFVWHDLHRLLNHASGDKIKGLAE
ncbi:GNAT family N-acetyltransferase [Agaribacterium haliotis]|uniref:GNAT family N-acetyltransferase n=1 Tax=Agaribacterium haliotis TaxID=2013869 RepID=UPI000BB5302E|nr:N-acetyltransferase [Agaribacterium haliotis]